MKKIALIAATAALAACTSSQHHEPMLGGDRDAHGCIGSAGYSWSSLQKKCVQPWDVADLKLNDPDSKTSAVYVIFAPDQSQAEVFSIDSSDGLILENVKGGYATRDGKLRLVRDVNEWVLKRTPR